MVEERWYRVCSFLQCLLEGLCRPMRYPPLALPPLPFLVNDRYYFVYTVFQKAEPDLQDGEWDRILRLAIVTGEEGPVCALLRVCPRLLLQVRCDDYLLLLYRERTKAKQYRVGRLSLSPPVKQDIRERTV